MAKYEALKLLYLRKIRKDEEYFEKLMENSEDEKYKKITDIALSPNNERELLIAESFYTYINTMKKLYEGIAHDDMEDSTIDENYGVMIFIDMIKKVRDGAMTSKEYWNELTPDNQARARYWFILANECNPLGVANYIGKRVGKELDYFTAPQELNRYIRELGIVIDEPFEDLDINDEKQVNDVILYTQELEKLVNNGKVHHNAEIANFAKSIINFGRKKK